jgi:WD40 repeat protein
MLKASELFEFDVTALDWSSDGMFLAVGDRKGNAKLVDANTLQVLGTLAAFNAGGKQPWVEDIKISPDC